MWEPPLNSGVAALKADPPARIITHVVNVFDGPLSSSGFLAQPATLESMKEARDFARGVVDVRLFSTQLEGEVPVERPYLRRLPSLRRTVMDFGEFARPRPLPLLRDILDRAYEVEEAEFIVYTNIDIGLQPHFYRLVDDLIDAGYDAFVINRRTVDAAYPTVAKLPQSFATVGRQHQGMDCFVFRRSAYPQFQLGNVAIGVPRVEFSLVASMSVTAERFAVFHDLHATFHWGNDARWRDPAVRDYWEHNKREADKATRQFQGDPRLVSDPYFALWMHRRGLLPLGLRKVSAWKPPGTPSRLFRTVKNGLGAVVPVSVKPYLKRIVGAVVALPGEPKDDRPEGSLLVEGLRKIRPTDVFLISFPGSGMRVLRSALSDVRSGRCLGRTQMGRQVDDDTEDRSNVMAVQLGPQKNAIEPLEDPRLMATHDTLFHLAPRCVYLVRDPRDVMVELFRRAQAAGEGAESFCRFLRSDACRSPVAQACQSLSWSQHVRAALRFAQQHPDRILIVRFEDLSDRPQSELSRLLSFCGTAEGPTSGPMLEVVRRWNPKVSIAEYGRHVFDEADLEYLAVHAGPALRAMHYDIGSFPTPGSRRATGYVMQPTPALGPS